MKLTKNCLYPWQFMQVHAGGMIQCCAVGNDTDLGDFIIDHCQKRERGEPSDILNSPGLVGLRHGLLTGNLRPMCRRCFFVDDNLVSTDFLRNRLVNELQKRYADIKNFDDIDLTRVHAYTGMAISFTNRCNLRCVYCIQSTQAKTNPYFKMDFPDKYAASTLDFFAAQGIHQMRSCVEGEPTVYKRWHAVFSAFKNKYPHIDLYMTTNLCRKYTDAEIELLARYTQLDVSCDTIDPELYHKLRYPGKVSIVLENITKIQAMAKKLDIKGPLISLHAVVSSATWKTLDALADYAFANNCIPYLGNYEERANAVAFQKDICRPLNTLPIEEQMAARDSMQRIKTRLQKVVPSQWENYVQGGLLYNINNTINHNYNRFSPFDDNPLHIAFFESYPEGSACMHFDIVYDYDNIAHTGVLFTSNEQTLHLEGIQASHIVIREVFIFAQGKCSHKYEQTILPGYRKTIQLDNGVFEYMPSMPPDVEKVLLEVVEYW